MIAQQKKSRPASPPTPRSWKFGGSPSGSSAATTNRSDLAPAGVCLTAACASASAQKVIRRVLHCNFPLSHEVK